MKVSIVSYINSYPFVHGLNHFADSSGFEIRLCPPSVCAADAVSMETDFALVPVASLPLLSDDFEVLPGYCIGAVRSVASVLLLSNDLVSNITRIFLDEDSLTSVALVKLLAKKYWKITPEFVAFTDVNFKPLPGSGDAILAIGDKCFDMKQNYIYAYDLFDAWHDWTNLPFVFAVWVASSKTTPSERERINEALSFGVNHIEDALNTCLTTDKQSDYAFYLNYLTQNINYILDAEKQKALSYFLELCTKA